MLTLFLAISGGVAWSQTMVPLGEALKCRDPFRQRGGVEAGVRSLGCRSLGAYGLGSYLGSGCFRVWV